MKIRVLSDVHNEHRLFEPEKVECDAVVLAGDIWTGTKGVEWANKHFDVPVIYVLGNHEYYRYAYPKLLTNMKEVAAEHVHVLENETFTLGDVTFLGCTLWTDFKLFGFGSEFLAKHRAKLYMNDYRAIRKSESYSRLRPEDTEEINRVSVKWLKKTLEATEGKKVVVTHHLPSGQSIAEDMREDVLSPAYASNLEGLLLNDYAPDVWIHGHSHHVVDYTIGDTRIVSNPRGYATREVPNFNPNFTIEV